MYHFVDVGAYKGCMSEKVAALGIQVHTFEPNPHLMGLIRERLDDVPNVTLYEKAWGCKEGRVVMYTPEPTSQSSSLYKEKKTSPGADELWVNTVNGAEFLRGLEGDIILYSNCEGSEFDFVPEILKDADLCRRIKMWVVSFHHGQHKIPVLKPKYLEIKQQMADMGITNDPDSHYDHNKNGQVDAFIKKVEEKVRE